MPSSTARLSWAALLGLVSVCSQTAGCGTTTSTGTTCDTDKLPKTDPCYQKACCDMVLVGPDGGVVSGDAGADSGASYRICGACNG